MAIKICGVTAPEAAAAAADAGATHLGFNFMAQSPRCITPEAAAGIAAAAPGLVAVALVAGGDEALLAEVLAVVRPALLQVYGPLPGPRPPGVGLIRPVAVAGAADLQDLTACAAGADWLLFDAKPARPGDRPGGRGEAFDWMVLAGRTIPRPWFLAGGLTPENVGRAIAESGARAVDVSSGVETRPGIKDPERIRRFIAAARSAFAERAA